jgi:hypothetical protein
MRCSRVDGGIAAGVSLNVDRNGFHAHGTHASRAALDAGIIAMLYNATR